MVISCHDAYRTWLVGSRASAWVKRSIALSYSLAEKALFPSSLSLLASVIVQIVRGGERAYGGD